MGSFVLSDAGTGPFLSPKQTWTRLSHGRHFDAVSQKEKRWFHLDLFVWPSAENYQETT